MSLTNKVVMVTGASRGIGRAIATLFAEKGARVVVHYNRDRRAAQQTLSALRGHDHLMLQADLTEPAAARRLAEAVVSQAGRIDVLVNNAGIFKQHSVKAVSYPAWQALWRETLQVNLLGPAFLTFCVLDYMRASGGGRIVNISSRGAFRGEPEAPAYGASKAGLNAFSQSMALALAKDKIFVYVVAPGFVDTDMAAELLRGIQGDAIRDQSPLGRVATPSEVARTVVFLAGEGPEFLTGSIVDINGASYLRS